MNKNPHQVRTEFDREAPKWLKDFVENFRLDPFGMTIDVSQELDQNHITIIIKGTVREELQ